MAPRDRDKVADSGHALLGPLAGRSASNGITRGLASSAASGTSSTPVSPEARLTIPPRTIQPQVAATEEQWALQHRTSHGRLIQRSRVPPLAVLSVNKIPGQLVFFFFFNVLKKKKLGQLHTGISSKLKQ